MLSIIGWILFILALMLSIGLHEIGHLLPAKRFGVKVSQYMVGFGPTVWSRKKGETEYGIKGIPLGGYIRMIGMFPPNQKGPVDIEKLGRVGTLIETLRETSLSEIEPAEEPRAFYNLSAPKKLIVMCGGPFMNLLIAVVVFFGVFVGIGNPVVSTQINSVVACVPTSDNPEGLISTSGKCDDGVFSPAFAAGMKVGDKIVGVDGNVVNSWADLNFRSRPGRTVSVNFLRNRQELTATVTLAAVKVPTLDASGQPTGKIETFGFFGVSPEVSYQKESLGFVLPFVGTQIRQTTAAILGFPKAIFDLGKQVVSGEERAASGPVSIVGIGQITGQIVSAPDESIKGKAHTFLLMIASLNMSLFLFNMIPMLPLDGGHIAGALYEGMRRNVARIRRKPLPGPADTAKLWPVAYVVTILLILMSLVTIFADLFSPISLG